MFVSFKTSILSVHRSKGTLFSREVNEMSIRGMIPQWGFQCDKVIPNKTVEYIYICDNTFLDDNWHYLDYIWYYIIYIVYMRHRVDYADYMGNKLCITHEYVVSSAYAIWKLKFSYNVALEILRRWKIGMEN